MKVKMVIKKLWRSHLYET